MISKKKNRLSHKVGGGGKPFQVSTDTCKKILVQSECDKKSGCRWNGESCVREWNNPRQDLSNLFVSRGGEWVSTRAKKLVSKRKNRSMKSGGGRMNRIKAELKAISEMSEPNPYISINPQINEETNGNVTMNGVITFPIDSVYYGGNFNVKIILDTKYPFSPPIIYLTTPMYHPNVSTDGNISVDKLVFTWSPIYTIYSLLTEIQNGLYKFDTTENMHVYDAVIFELFTENRPEFNRIARENVEKHAL